MTHEEEPAPKPGKDVCCSTSECGRVHCKDARVPRETSSLPLSTSTISGHSVLQNGLTSEAGDGGSARLCSLSIFGSPWKTLWPLDSFIICGPVLPHSLWSEPSV